MKRNLIAIQRSLGVLLLATLTACEAEKDQLLPPSAGNIRVYTGTQSGADISAGTLQGEQLKACLIFWREGNYKDYILQGNWPANPPYLVAHPEEGIDFYRVANGIPYDTKHSYPVGGAHVHVTGFAPVDLETEDNYRTLLVPEAMQTGEVDFLSGDGSKARTGTAEKPFEKGTEDEKKAKQLEFCHLTAKVLVEAKRDVSMAQRIGVQNVKVTLKEVQAQPVQVPASFKWKVTDKPNEAGGYYPERVVAPSGGIKLEAIKDGMIIMGVNQKVDSCYVYAAGEHYHPGETEGGGGNITLAMDIEAELIPYKDNNWAYEQLTKRTWDNQEVTITSKTGDALHMGYAYKVIITFSISDIRLQGMEVEWSDGGKHFIPITPEEEEHKEEGGNNA